MTNASGFINDAERKVIFGGSAGMSNCPAVDPNSTCNTCVMGTMDACNPTAIHSTLKLRIEGRTDNTTLLGQNPRVVVQKSNGDPITSSGSTDPSTSGVFVAEVTWSDVCGAIGATGCTTSSSGIIKVGVGKTGSSGFEGSESIEIEIVVSGTTGGPPLNTTRCVGSGSASLDGFCFANMVAGDGKVGVKEIYESSSFPSASSSGDIKWNRVVFFYEPRIGTDPDVGTTLTRIGNKSPSQSFSFDNSIKPATVDVRITGLENQTQYCFIMGNQDEAGNITNFTNLASYPNVGEKEDFLCALPDTVVGLLDDKKCFIATAAWGSAMDPHVKTLRSFRDRFLKTNSVGRAFVETYYRYSPPAAQFIAQNEFLRTAVRMALWPLVAFAEIFLLFGFVPVALTLLAAAATGIFTFRRLRSRMV